MLGGSTNIKKNVYFIGIGNASQKLINPSSQYIYYNCSRKCKILNDTLKEKYSRTKLILEMNSSVKNNSKNNDNVMQNNIILENISYSINLRNNLYLNII